MGSLTMSTISGSFTEQFNLNRIKTKLMLKGVLFNETFIVRNLSNIKAHLLLMIAGISLKKRA